VNVWIIVTNYINWKRLKQLQQLDGSR